jgi:phenylalanyl-tRNA synthetase beta chain
MIDVWDQPFASSELSLRPDRTNALLGIEIPVDRQVELLDGLGLSPKLVDGAIVCTIPSHRADLRQEADLIEEVARLEGYDKIPIASQVTHAVTGPSPSQHLRRQVEQLLTAAGYDEAVTFSFIDDRDAELFGQADPVRVDASVRRSNNALRTTLIPSLLRVCKANQDAGNAEVNLFELASVFPPAENSELPDEYVELGLVTTGELRELRGVLEELIARTAPDATVETVPAPSNALDDTTSAVVRVDGVNAGVIGRISRQVQDHYSLERDLHAATIRFDALLSHAGNTKRYRPLPKFPPARRDLSLIVDDAVTWRQIADAVTAVDQPMRVALDYVATYRGKPVPAGRKSVTLRLVYRSDAQTLRSEEVDGQVQDIVLAMTKNFAAELRQS